MSRSFKCCGTYLLLLFIVLSDAQANAQQADGMGQLLLRVISSGPLSARMIEFTEIETREVIRFNDLIEIGRRGERQYFLHEIPAGEYFLSSIFPLLNRNDNVPRINLDESAGTVIILAGAINYIGDVLFISEETGLSVHTRVDYQANSETLNAAVRGAEALFRELPTVVSIPGNAPVGVAKELLGL